MVAGTNTQLVGRSSTPMLRMGVSLRAVRVEMTLRAFVPAFRRALDPQQWQRTAAGGVGARNVTIVFPMESKGSAAKS